MALTVGVVTATLKLASSSVNVILAQEVPKNLLTYHAPCWRSKKKWEKKGENVNIKKEIHKENNTRATFLVDKSFDVFTSDGSLTYFWFFVNLVFFFQVNFIMKNIYNLLILIDSKKWNQNFLKLFSSTILKGRAASARV